MDGRTRVITSAELGHYLADRGGDPASVRSTASLSASAFSFRATDFYLDLIDWADDSDPLRRMILPDPREREAHAYEREDPIGDRAHQPVPGVVHRYPDRCLVMPTAACALHCRFCFRRNLLGRHRWDAGEALRYIANHAEIKEVIFSGGDPMMLTDAELGHLVNRIGEIGHILRLRLHTRAPVADPARVSESLIRALTGRLPLAMVLHVNHPREITPGLRRAVQRLRSAGIRARSQSVLLRGVNDRPDVLENLCAGLVDADIQPYYLHHPDPAAGTHHFRVSMEEGRRLYGSIRRRLPDRFIPEYVLDTPGGPGKTPVMAFHRTGARDYEARYPGGDPILYQDHADDAQGGGAV